METGKVKVDSGMLSYASPAACHGVSVRSEMEGVSWREENHAPHCPGSCGVVREVGSPNSTSPTLFPAPLKAFIKILLRHKMCHHTKTRVFALKTGTNNRDESLCSSNEDSSSIKTSKEIENRAEEHTGT